MTKQEMSLKGRNVKGKKRKRKGTGKGRYRTEGERKGNEKVRERNGKY